MSALYGGYLNLAMIALGGLACLFIVKASDWSAVNRAISIDENACHVQDRTLQPPQANPIEDMLARLYERGVMQGGFIIPRAKDMKKFCRLNRILFYWQIHESLAESGKRLKPRMNIAVHDMHSIKEFTEWVNSYGTSNSAASLLYELGYINVVIC